MDQDYQSAGVVDPQQFVTPADWFIEELDSLSFEDTPTTAILQWSPVQPRHMGPVLPGMSTTPAFFIQLPCQQVPAYFVRPQEDHASAYLLWMQTGAPLTAIVLECLNAMGIKTVAGYGSAGSLISSPPGKLVVPIEAIRDEGTSIAYAPQDETACPSPWLASAIIHDFQLDVRQPRVWTTDALFRETSAKIRFARRQGAWCVDMETSALFIVASALEMSVATLLYLADEVSTSSPWELRDLNDEKTEHAQQLAQLVNVVRRL